MIYLKRLLIQQRRAEMMKKTPLYENHVSLGARMVEYAGWNMPVQYTGVAEEVLAVRNDVGIFDVSHMGEIEVKGKDAADFLDWLMTRKVSGKQPDQVTYTILAQPDGGTVDDLLVYQTGEDTYLLAVNAANKDKDVVFINDSLPVFAKKKGDVDVTVTDYSPDYGQIALQGPKSAEKLAEFVDSTDWPEDVKEAVKGVKRFRQVTIPSKGDGPDWMISKTGYTGENGYEFYLPWDETPALWEKLIEMGVKPCGLGSRDTLRLEAGLPLYGHEMSPDISALDGGMGFFVDKDREFQGCVMRETHSRRILPLVSETKAIPREGYRVFAGEEEIGVITSGTFSPVLGKGIANAIIGKDVDVEGKEIFVEVRRKMQPFSVTSSPFVKLG
jgi:aminomethyltransferase